MKNTLQFPQDLSRSVRMITVALLALSLAVCAQAQTFYYFAVFNGANGSGPSKVIQATDGNFYGTSADAGASHPGNVFRITPAGEITSIYDFCSKPHCADGAAPTTAPVLGSDGNLYGVTFSGGANNGQGGWGTVYKMTLGGQITTLYNFCNVAPCLDGASPTGIIQGGDGSLYGTTSGGGQFGAGTLFKISQTGEFTLLHAFCSLANCADGRQPNFPPIQGSDGNFYGTTSGGGTNGGGGGVVYTLTQAGIFNAIYTFRCAGEPCPKGYDPTTVVQDAKGNLLGTTFFGGANQQGLVFEITPTHQFHILHSFTYGDESGPGGLILANDGNLYGTTEGIDGFGTIFEVTPERVYTTLHNFGVKGGYNPGGLFQAPTGNFYGPAAYGNNGTIFSLSNGLSPLVETVPVAGKVGQSVIIVGNGLTGSTRVTFNGVEAAFTVKSDTYIKATVPAGATTGTVSVSTPSGTLNSNPQFVVTK